MTTVVLLHGLARTARSMRPVARTLEARGFRVVNLDYPSRSGDIRTLAHGVAHDVARIDSGGPMHFVTHSLGGVLLRVAAAEGLIPAERIARVVMLAPPNGGSHVVDALARRPSFSRVYRWAMGPVGPELGVEGDAIARSLPPLPFETGIIAGSRSVNPLLSRLLPGENDGKVSVAHAAAPGMRAFIVVPHSHSFLMRAKVVLAQTATFLETGRFK